MNQREIELEILSEMTKYLATYPMSDFAAQVKNNALDPAYRDTTTSSRSYVYGVSQAHVERYYRAVRALRERWEIVRTN